MTEGKTLEQILEAALRRVMAANARLGSFKGKITLYEGSPTNDQDVFEAWVELNDAIGQGKVALQAAQIKRDPDVDDSAGPDIAPSKPVMLCNCGKVLENPAMYAAHCAEAPSHFTQS